MKKIIIPFLLVAVLTACGQSETPQKADASKANIPTVEELAANPERLKELRQQCKTDRPKLGDVLCNRVSEQHLHASFKYQTSVRVHLLS